MTAVPDPFDDGSTDWATFGEVLEDVDWECAERDAELVDLLDSLNADESHAALSNVPNEQGSAGYGSATGACSQAQPAPQGVPRNPMSSDASDVGEAMRRMERIRAKNRRAQARHRQKVKVRAYGSLQHCSVQPVSLSMYLEHLVVGTGMLVVL